MEDFEQAVGRFREFLIQNGYSGKIVWVWPEDVVWTEMRSSYVRFPTPEVNTTRAREKFERSLAEGLGVRMETVCEVEDVACCRLWGDRAEHDKATGAWPIKGLMMSARTSRASGKAVRSRWQWVWLKLRYSKQRRYREMAFG